MDKYGNKDFKGWIKLKEKIHYRKTTRTINEGEVWWCKIGENVGDEICGKGKDFLRPVVIIKKLTKANFIGIPLTSKRHVGSWYVNFEFDHKNECAVVAQVENISSYRLHYKIGELPESDLDKILSGLHNLLG